VVWKPGKLQSHKIEAFFDVELYLTVHKSFVSTSLNIDSSFVSASLNIDSSFVSASLNIIHPGCTSFFLAIPIGRY
jgi:hypothetical protein